MVAGFSVHPPKPAPDLSSIYRTSGRCAGRGTALQAGAKSKRNSGGGAGGGSSRHSGGGRGRSSGGGSGGSDDSSNATPPSIDLSSLRNRAAKGTRREGGAVLKAHNGFLPREEALMTPPPLPCSDAAAAWGLIRREAREEAAAEPILSSFLYSSILSHDSFDRSLAFILAHRLADDTLTDAELFQIFCDVLDASPGVADAARADIFAVHDRDPACSSHSQALLYSKGFHAIQAQRIAHELWKRGSRVLALTLQSRMSEVFAADLHPGARFGWGIFLDHGTGVVIGETAVIGNDVSILQNVTLGGTGKESGDRHPKVSSGVLIGASAAVLGNIKIGRGSQIAAGSLVLRPVPPQTMVAGSPAREVGKVIGNPSERMDAWCEGDWPPSSESDAEDPAPRKQSEERDADPEPEWFI